MAACCLLTAGVHVAPLCPVFAGAWQCRTSKPEPRTSGNFLPGHCRAAGSLACREKALLTWGNDPKGGLMGDLFQAVIKPQLPAQVHSQNIDIIMKRESDGDKHYFLDSLWDSGERHHHRLGLFTWQIFPGLTSETARWLSWRKDHGGYFHEVCKVFRLSKLCTISWPFFHWREVKCYILL